jgi:hypothetical protein
MMVLALLIGRFNNYTLFRSSKFANLRENISICNTRMYNAAAVVRQPYSPGGAV